MSDEALHRIEAIQSMLSAGQRPVRMEPASLIIWGLVMGGLAAGLEVALRPLGRIAPLALALIVSGALATGLGVAAIVDRRLTRRARARRGESIAFTERQVTKAWMLLVALGILLTFATFFFGGVGMNYAVWLVLIGLGLFLHGLFSEQLPEWVGVAMILLGVVPLALGASVGQTRWIAAAAFGVGLPLLAAMLDGGAHVSLVKRLAQSLGWLTAVLSAAFLAWQTTAAPSVGDAPTVSLDRYLAGGETTGTLIVHVPAGTTLPFTMEVAGDVLASEPGSNMTVKVQRPVELLIKDGKPTGYARLPGEEWRHCTLTVVATHPEAHADASNLFLASHLRTTIGYVR